MYNWMLVSNLRNNQDHCGYYEKILLLIMPKRL